MKIYKYYQHKKNAEIVIAIEEMTILKTTYLKIYLKGMNIDYVEKADYDEISDAKYFELTNKDKVKEVQKPIHPNKQIKLNIEKRSLFDRLYFR